jgi:capsular exopolysaccharide synthesis family protein
MVRAGSTSIPRSRKDASEWFGTIEFYEEAVNTLLSSTLIGRRGRALRSILVTSAVSDEGKSMCVAHMAAAFARQGHRTLLIDADLRNPSQQKLFVLDSGLGLADAIDHNVPLTDIRQRVGNNEMLHVIAAGTSGVLYDRIGNKVREILLEVGGEYDLVFIDAPPMLYFAEPLDLASIVDGVIVVSHAGQTSRHAVSVVLATLRRLGANTLGIVLNRVKCNMSATYQPYRSYYKSA